MRHLLIESPAESSESGPARHLPTKIELSLFDPFVKRVFPRIEARIPPGVTANQVTIAGHFASLLAAVFLVLSPSSRWWCLAAAVMIFCHWFADTLDGPMARVRGTSDLGHYLDHYGDVVDSVLVGLAIFMTPGSHLSLGVVVVILDLLSWVHAQLKSELTGITIIPRFGSTELHLVAIIGLIAQVAFDYAKPLSWFDSITGSSGSLTALLKFDSGLTLVDHLGILACAGGFLQLAADVLSFVWSLKRADRG
jgi:phosphatidylglycerophosphate synthase